MISSSKSKTLLKAFAKFLVISFIILITALLVYPLGYYILDDDPNFIPIEQPKSMKVGSIGVYAINLKGAHKRLEFLKIFTNQLPYDFNLISAVNGNKMSDDEIKNLIDVRAYKKMLLYLPQKGVIGCTLSHIKVWKQFLESDYEYALILEDDIAFNPEAMQKVVNELVQKPKFWDLVTLQQSRRGGPKKIFSLSTGHTLSIYSKYVLDSGAYLINRKAANNLLKKALPMKMPIDHYFTRGWELDIKFTGIENPRMAVQIFGDSHILSSNLIKHDSLTKFEYIENRVTNFQSELIRRYKTFVLYRQLKRELNEG